MGKVEVARLKWTALEARSRWLSNMPIIARANGIGRYHANYLLGKVLEIKDTDEEQTLGALWLGYALGLLAQVHEVEFGEIEKLLKEAASSNPLDIKGEAISVMRLFVVNGG